MGTRSLTHIRETENASDLVCIYRQFDGYPSGLGKALAGVKRENASEALRMAVRGYFRALPG